MLIPARVLPSMFHLHSHNHHHGRFRPQRARGYLDDNTRVVATPADVAGEYCATAQCARLSLLRHSSNYDMTDGRAAAQDDRFARGIS